MKSWWGQGKYPIRCVIVRVQIVEYRCGEVGGRRRPAGSSISAGNGGMSDLRVSCRAVLGLRGAATA